MDFVAVQGIPICTTTRLYTLLNVNVVSDLKPHQVFDAMGRFVLSTHVGLSMVWVGLVTRQIELYLDVWFDQKTDLF